MDDPDILIDRCIVRYREKIISSVRDIVRIRSVAGDPGPSEPFGPGPARALAWTLQLADSLGLSTSNLENYTGYAEYGEGSEYIAVLGHLDSVPEGDGWHHPPFGAEVADGKIYGRGVLDDKGPIIAALFGLIAIKESGLDIRRKVRVIFGTDEETGSLDMNYYLSREPPPISGFTPDAEFPVVFAEKGILWVEFSGHYRDPPSATRIISVKGGSAVNMVPDSASAVIRTDRPVDIIRGCSEFANNTGYLLSAESESDLVTVRCKGLSAHGSTPGLGKNAIMHLMAYLGTLPSGPAGTGPIIGFFNSRIGQELTGLSMGISLSDPVLGDLTLNCGKIEVAGGLFSLTVDIRYPGTASAEEITRLITNTLTGIGINARVIKHDPPVNFSPESELVETLRSVYGDFTGDPSPPVAIGGGTYARRLPNIVAFGPYRPGQTPPIHGADEYIGCEDLISDAKIYARAIYRLANKQ